MKSADIMLIHKSRPSFMTGKIMFSFCGGISHTLLSPHAWAGQDITKNGIMHYNSIIQQTAHRVKFALFLLWGAGFHFFVWVKMATIHRFQLLRREDSLHIVKTESFWLHLGLCGIVIAMFYFFLLLAFYRPNKSIQSNCFCSDCM